MDHAISIRRLTKHYGPVQALTDLDLEVPVGSIFGFLGANGAGKTTAIKVIAGLSRPTSGSVEVMGVPLDRGEDYKRAIGYLGQEPRFYDWMTGRETLEYVGRFYPWMRESLDSRARELLTLVGLSDAGDRRTATYSGGMRQRLGIAQALVGRPDVLLLDEPVSALDPIGRRDVLDLMNQLRSHATIFYSTHILDDVQRVSDHVAILDKGRLVTTARTNDLLKSFTRGRLRVVLAGADERTQAAIGAIPGVSEVRVDGRDGHLVAFGIQTEEGQTQPVQRAVTRYASDAGLTLVSNSEASLELEDVFLRLIDTKERAA